MKKNKTYFALSLTIICFISGCKPKDVNVQDFQSNVLISWNEKVMQIAKEEDGLMTLKGLRTATLMHLAVHDALNSIVPKYRAYSYEQEVVNVNPMATAAFAMYEIATQQYPDQKKVFDELLSASLVNLEEKDSSLAKELGTASATAILAKRTNDSWNGEAEYTWHPMAPGVYAEFNKHSGTPEGFIFGAGWARAKTFMLPKQDHFRSPPPPEINSADYTKAFNEVKTVGSHNSTTRTDDQAHLAMWWKDFVENSHNRLARELIQKEKLNLWEAARVFALMNMTVYDAYINVFDNKFHYNHWRPYTAIRWAENDENPDTVADTEWSNLHNHTYAFPSYPSAHGTASSAAMTVLAETLSTGDDYDFTMVTAAVEEAGPFSEKVKMQPPTRSFSSFSEAGLEAAMSRVYLGIHFRYDSEEGHRLGNKIGNYAIANYLQPLEKK
ncbi:vanadium-dependent haloperoxidase [Croceivirga thetidis]|uniref:Vanadium-dependent haloperoxidase n=1 Tax=Croceivirga thetidis TaxID=2721623 RepID=A0ABX1GQB7_9FLAO|nr:vanadium-dependent haloperoxidase [Croceivirga thetidis]NKI31814.1 vanadium-dependent haloperoxidase [Croceivirga thetidis]